MDDGDRPGWSREPPRFIANRRYPNRGGPGPNGLLDVGVGGEDRERHRAVTRVGEGAGAPSPIRRLETCRYSAGGRRTASMTWITPLEASMSVAVTMTEPLRMTLPPSTVIVMSSPSSVVALSSPTTVSA